MTAGFPQALENLESMAEKNPYMGKSWNMKNDEISYKNKVATVREKVWKMKFFPGQGKVREFGFESGKIEKVHKVREKSGNFKIFSKVMVFGNVSMS